MGNRIYGCDDCLAVCPWNKFAQVAVQCRVPRPRGTARADVWPIWHPLTMPPSAVCSPASPIKRIGRDRFIRNVLIAIGNSGEARLAPSAQRLLDDASPLVRGAAVWALSRLLTAGELETLRMPRRETDPSVAAEWTAALGHRY